jgi:hypothetical protein
VIDSLLNLLFRCSHRNLTRPVAPLTKAGQPHGQSYVVCLDCGKQFDYDVREMRMGKAIDHSHDAGVVPPKMSVSRSTKMKYAVLAATPLALAVGAVFKAMKAEPAKTGPAANEPTSGRRRKQQDR